MLGIAQIGRRLIIDCNGKQGNEKCIDKNTDRRKIDVQAQERALDEQDEDTQYGYDDVPSGLAVRPSASLYVVAVYKTHY